MAVQKGIKGIAQWAANDRRMEPELIDREFYVEWFDDFNHAALNVTDGPWKSNTVETGGTPTVALVADTAGGEVACTLEATSESQRAELYFGDQLTVDIAKKPIVEMRVKFATIAASEFAVVGLASARNDAYDSIATNLWFRLDGDMDILIEGDDGTTDTDDVDSNIDAVNGTYLHLKIDATDLSAVRFFIDGVKVSTEIAIAAATGTLQPFIAVGKTTGTGVPSVTCDFIMIQAER